MEKPAVTTLAIHPVIKKRWSPRSFDPSRRVEQEKIDRFLEAARWAPSSFNEQPWRFIIGQRGDDTWERIVGTMVAFNQKWAKNADVLVMALGKKSLTKTGKPNGTYQYDVGGSMAYITFQAVADGLVTHQMGGFSKEDAIKAFGIPDDLEPLTLIAIGYQDEPGKLEDSFYDMETASRTRHERDFLLFRGSSQAVGDPTN